MKEPINKALQKVLMSEKNTIPIEKAIENAKKKYKEHRK